MTTVVDALNRIARQVSVAAPSSWVNATADEHVEIRDDFLQDTIDDLLQRIDWPQPIGATVTITGTGAETYSLPADFKRLQRQLAVYDEALDRHAIPITSDGDWLELQEDGIAGADRFYRLTGYDGAWSISFWNVPTTDIVVQYVSKNWMATSAGVAGSDFTAEDDVLLFDRRLIEAGTIWRWRERKGLPFLDKMNEYEALLAKVINDQRGRQSVRMTRGKPVRWQDRVPAFIPDS